MSDHYSNTAALDDDDPFSTPSAAAPAAEKSAPSVGRIINQGLVWWVVWESLGISARFSRFAQDGGDWKCLVDVLEGDGSQGNHATGRHGRMTNCGLLAGTNREKLLKEVGASFTRADLRTEVDRQLRWAFGAIWDRVSQPEKAVSVWEFHKENLQYAVSYVGEDRSVRGMIVLGEINVLQGDGGSTKSYQAMAMTLAVASGRQVGPWKPLAQAPVLYIDWETRGSTVMSRLSRLCAAQNLQRPDVLYKRALQPLKDMSEDIRQEVLDHDIKFVVIDSVSAAVGSDLTGDSTMPFMSALRLLGDDVTVVVIAHVSLASVNDKRRTGPRRMMGSVQGRNQARRCIEVKRVAGNPIDRTAVIAMTVEKANDDAMDGAPCGIRIQWSGTDGPVIMGATSAEQTPELGEEDSMEDRVERALLQAAGGHLGTKDMSEELDIPLGKMRRILQSMEVNGRLVQVSEGGGRGREAQWRLAHDEPGF